MPFPIGLVPIVGDKIVFSQSSPLILKDGDNDVISIRLHWEVYKL